MKQRFRNKIRREERRRQALARFKILSFVEWRISRKIADLSEAMQLHSEYVERKNLELLALGSR
jgi:hypothetical protein